MSIIVFLYPLLRLCLSDKKQVSSLVELCDFKRVALIACASVALIACASE